MTDAHAVQSARPTRQVCAFIRRHRSRRVLGGAAIVALLAAWPESVAAQAGGDDFLFQPPRLTLSLRGGYALARAGSDLFDFTTSHLTLDKADFNSPILAADAGFRLTERMDFVLGLAFARSSAQSEYREYVEEGPDPNSDADDLPIEQTTSLTRVPVTGSLRYYLTSRGRSIGRFAYVPARVAPYAGLGGGGMWYRFDQEGDFVDVDDPNLGIFTSEFESSGWSMTGHAFAGVEVSLSRRSAFNVEARYIMGASDLDAPFVDFDPIDLAGLQTTIGLSFRF